MKTSDILILTVKILFPFIILFGLYVIINGHLSPGGGFQGGAILATAMLTIYFIIPDKITNLNILIKIEKYFFIFIILLAIISFFTKGEVFTNFLNSDIKIRSIFLIILNIFIGFKVSLGLITTFSTFIEEGRK